MKISQILENDAMSLIKMMTQSISNVKLDPKVVDVAKKQTAGTQKKQCFNNSFKSVLSDTDRMYVLGYVFFHGIPIEHAWIKENGKYFDVTLDPKGQDEYVSIAEFSFTEVSEYVDKFGSAPSLYDMNRFIGNKSRNQ